MNNSATNIHIKFLHGNMFLVLVIYLGVELLVLREFHV